jgi:hypothetical protein
VAEVKRSLIMGLRKKARTLGPAVAAVSLPIQRSVPSDSLSDYFILIHGEKKIGKTTLSTVEPGVFLMTWDPFQKALAILQAYMPDWGTFMKYLEALEAAAKAGKYPYKRVVIDGCDIWYRACQTWVCKKLVIDHPNDEGFGKGWDLLKETFANAVDRLMALPGGCWFISHSHWRELETRQKNVKIEKLLPQMKGGAEEILVGRVDGWFAYDYWGEERCLIVRGDERTGAGNRIKGHFMTPDNRPVSEVPMGENEEEAWANLNAAFNNEQTFATMNERDGVTSPPTERVRLAPRGIKPSSGGGKPAAAPKLVFKSLKK